ncbi:hypothetical protein ABW19_dt0203676 [Dactylella cylindrospora]|nr:hypothetical protein ABW19_dt0203676 [Dactylella cylindrospora]
MRTGGRISSLLHTTHAPRSSSLVHPVTTWVRHQSTTTPEGPTVGSFDTLPPPNRASSSRPPPGSKPPQGASSKPNRPKWKQNNSPKRSIFNPRIKPMGTSTDWLKEYLESSGVEPTIEQWRLLSKKSDVYRYPLTRKEFDDIISGVDTAAVPNWSTQALQKKHRDVQAMRAQGIIEKKPYILSITGEEPDLDAINPGLDPDVIMQPPIGDGDISFESLFETFMELKPRTIAKVLQTPALKRLRNEYVHNLVKLGLEDGILGVNPSGKIFVGQVKFIRKLLAVGLNKDFLSYYHVTSDTREITFDHSAASLAVEGYAEEKEPVPPVLQKMLVDAGLEEPTGGTKVIKAAEAKPSVKDVSQIRPPEQEVIQESAAEPQLTESPASEGQRTESELRPAASPDEKQSEVELLQAKAELSRSEVLAAEHLEVKPTEPDAVEQLELKATEEQIFTQPAKETLEAPPVPDMSAAEVSEATESTPADEASVLSGSIGVTGAPVVSEQAEKTSATPEQLEPSRIDQPEVPLLVAGGEVGASEPTTTHETLPPIAPTAEAQDTKVSGLAETPASEPPDAEAQTYKEPQFAEESYIAQQLRRLREAKSSPQLQTQPKKPKPKPEDELLKDIQEALASKAKGESATINSAPTSTPPQEEAKASSTPATSVDDEYEYLRHLAASSQEEEKDESERDGENENDEYEDEYPRPRRPF